MWLTNLSYLYVVFSLHWGHIFLSTWGSDTSIFNFSFYHHWEELLTVKSLWQSNSPSPLLPICGIIMLLDQSPCLDISRKSKKKTAIYIYTYIYVITLSLSSFIHTISITYTCWLQLGLLLGIDSVITHNCVV